VRVLTHSTQTQPAVEQSHWCWIHARRDCTAAKRMSCACRGPPVELWPSCWVKKAKHSALGSSSSVGFAVRPSRGEAKEARDMVRTDGLERPLCTVVWREVSPLDAFRLTLSTCVLACRLILQYCFLTRRRWSAMLLRNYQSLVCFWEICKL
jgi:hypothetical protein